MSEHTAVCPICNGTKEIPLSAQEKKYPWNKDKETKPCLNCGGQYQNGRALGYVSIDLITNEGCIHEYVQTLAGRCYHEYNCKYCGDRYFIDSGD